VAMLLRWCDATLPEGTYFKDWEPCDHPQLGSVETGGFYYKQLTQNPPTVRAAATAAASVLSLSRPRSYPQAVSQLGVS
jgi:hypothetical protein